MIHDPALQPLIAEQRRAMAALGGAMPPPRESVLAAQECQLPSGLTVRVIHPPGAVRAVMLHIHGGGFAFGAPAMADADNSALAVATGIATVSVQYRLAPQYPHPAALEDCETALLWLLETAQQRFGCERILIGGESVGASLAVLTLLRLRDRHQSAQRVCGANLVVGCYDFSMTPSQRQSTAALFLSPERLRATVSAAFPGVGTEALRDPQISALYASLHGLPPALFSVGTGDAVLDDSLFMAMRWRAAGNLAELAVYPEAPHLFLQLATAMAAEGRRRIASFVTGCIAS
jgi:acetyl esterase